MLLGKFVWFQVSNLATLVSQMIRGKCDPGQKERGDKKDLHLDNSSNYNNEEQSYHPAIFFVTFE